MSEIKCHRLVPGELFCFSTIALALLIVLTSTSAVFAQSTWDRTSSTKSEPSSTPPPPASTVQNKSGDTSSQAKETDKSSSSTTSPRLKPPRTRHDLWICYKLAHDPWLDKEAAADPGLVQAICNHAGPARILAQHPRINYVADADHYLCRRLTRWKAATWKLIQNPHADHVIALDPEGIYRAIKRNPKVARILAKNMMFNQMVVENPELGKFIARHM